MLKYFPKLPKQKIIVEESNVNDNEKQEQQFQKYKKNNSDSNEEATVEEEVEVEVVVVEENESNNSSISSTELELSDGDDESKKSQARKTNKKRIHRHMFHEIWKKRFSWLQKSNMGVLFDQFSEVRCDSVMMNRKILCQILYNSVAMPSLRSISSATASITRIHRAKFSRTYPTKLVFPNGSTIEIRYPEPRAIIKLPVNLSLLSDDEKRLYLEKRKPKQKIKVVEEKLISYDPTKYVKRIRKK